ncbi:nucleotidyltransferase family protein [Flaviaesturariibacter amylovorans]|uniref:Nucleotidyltransferase family protein n=1 Tax=Flaviaesturariibacter amylovorans TaxID=1084520 RepID=A0ABP8GAW1_9BACT
MKAMIFAAGLGTRFKPWTDQHPKALAVVNGKTLLQRAVEYLQQYGINEVVVNVHHFAEQVEQAVAESKGWGSRIHISDERDELLDTGGGMLKAKQWLETGTFVTLNVDILSDANLKDFLVEHQQDNAVITLATSDRDSSRKLIFNKYDRLCGWRNESSGEEKIVLEAKDHFPKAYSGMAIFEPAVFNLTKLTGKFSLIDLYLELAHDNKISSWDHSGTKLLDVGKPGSVEEAERIFA